MSMLNPKEYKVVALRDCPVPETLHLCDTPDKVTAYWREHVQTEPRFNPDVETLVVLLLNTRRRLLGHVVVATGLLDQVIAHPREVFRPAIAAAATSAIVLAHNHPSGDPTPSEADLKVTRELVRAGQIVKIEVLDHVVIGNRCHVSMRERGWIST